MLRNKPRKHVLIWGRFVSLLLLLTFISQSQTALAEASFPQTDQTPLSPMATSPAIPAQPDYISGFSLGSDNAYAIFYEERTATAGCVVGGTYRIYTNQTSSGPFGFAAAPSATNICDSHFLAKDWPITIGAAHWSYRAWGAGNYSGQHNFYVSNDRINWTLVGTFTFPDPFGDQILYGFHDVVQLNGHYLGFAESAGGHTYIVSSTTGDQNNWIVVSRVGGIGGAIVPPDHLILSGPAGPIPSGNFVLMEVGGKLVYGKLYIPGIRSAAYMIINGAAAQAATPTQAEAAFLDVNNWTWANGTTGPASSANAVLTDTSTATSGHNIREAWTAPMSDPHADHVILYVAQYIFATSTRRGLGCASSSAQCLVVLPAVPSPTPAPKLTSIIPATGFAPMRMTRLTIQPDEKAYSASEIRLEIPALNVNAPIVGVPLVNDNWDVTWLGDKAGYLEGTAFPTLPGNSAIAGHVYNSDGEPGPFIGLVQLRYGAEIYLHAWGEKYIYQVRENRLTTPNDQSVFKHEEYSWITLLTCQGYDQTNNTYKWRRAVRAVLVKVVADP